MTELSKEEVDGLGKCDTCGEPAVVKDIHLGRTPSACFLVRLVVRRCAQHEEEK